MHRFLIDARLPPALARKLAAMGHEATHLLDVGLLESSVGAIWDYAMSQGAIIVTKDEDFAIRASVSEAPPRIVWISNRQLQQRKIAGLARTGTPRCNRGARIK
ncbi:MAG: DUF5615 family PIN-like protein [Pseudomonadota bacterium]